MGTPVENELGIQVEVRFGMTGVVPPAFSCKRYATGAIGVVAINVIRATAVFVRFNSVVQS